MTTQPTDDGLHAAIDQADVTATRYTLDWQGYVQELTRAWAAERQGLLDRIAVLEEGDPPPPPRMSTIFGSSKPIVANVPATRVYVASGKRPKSPAELPSDQRQALTRVAADGGVVLSWKEPPGTWLSPFLESIHQLLPDATVYGCQNHEPYDNFSGASGLKEYHARWDAAVPVMLDHGVIPTTILDGSRPESWESFTRADALVYGMDRYNPGIQHPPSYMTPPLIFGAYMEYLVAHGMPGLLAETGSGRTAADLDGSGQLAWTKDTHHYLEASGLIVAALWWSSADMTLTQKLWEAWLNG